MATRQRRMGLVGVRQPGAARGRRLISSQGRADSRGRGLPFGIEPPSGSLPLETEAHDMEAAKRGNDSLRMSCPLSAKPRAERLPLMVYIPGLDGTGLAASTQMPKLAEYFRVEALTNPADNRDGIDELTDYVAKYIEARREQILREEGQGKPVYILGESLGALCALSVAQSRPELVDKLVLVNPATSFENSFWYNLADRLSDLPEIVHRTLPYVFAPLMGDPARVALTRLGGPAAVGIGENFEGANFDQVSEVGWEALSMLGEMGFLEDLLPPATIRHRIDYAQKASKTVNARLLDVKAPVLVLTGGGDILLPSTEEGRRLERELPDCQSVEISNRSHALMLEDGVDVARVLVDQGFYTTFPEPHTFGNGKSSSLANDASFEAPKPSTVGNAKQLVGGLRRLLSPKFFTRGSDGSVVEGLGGVEDERPMIFVGNHELYAFDLGIIIDEFLREKNMLLRGLAHLAVWDPPSDGVGGGTPLSGPPQPEDENERREGPRQLFESFGAVPVTGRSLYKLMQNREAALLFPGGVSEAYKRKGEMYELKWPDKPEFVRTAIKFGATIVPFGAVGLEDSFNMLLDGGEQLEIPFVADDIRRRQSEIPNVRPDENFIAPVSLPGLPRRLYVSFGSPIRTKGMDVQDLQAARELYERVYDGVRAEIDWLLEMRKRDPYDHALPRFFYETTWNGRPAPTFPLLRH